MQLSEMDTHLSGRRRARVLAPPPEQRKTTTADRTHAAFYTQHQTNAPSLIHRVALHLTPSSTGQDACSDAPSGSPQGVNE